MKILIYGAGVIGCTYAWQLNKSGYDVSLLVRKGKKQAIETNGIPMRYADYRNGKQDKGDFIFRPPVIDRLTADNDFEYILITVTNRHLDEVLPVLKESAGKAHILFFQNLWYTDLEKINNYLTPGQYFFGFPFMAGGGKDECGIQTIISGSQYSKTMLGEANGTTTPRVEKIVKALSDAGMTPFISGRIISWLLPHTAFIGAISAGIIRAGGSMQILLSNRRVLRETIFAIREGFHICDAIGINPKQEKVNRLYYLPLFICIPIMRKVFSDPAMQNMFDQYITHSTDEIKSILTKVTQSGEKYNLKTPCLNSFSTLFRLLWVP